MSDPRGCSVLVCDESQYSDNSDVDVLLDKNSLSIWGVVYEASRGIPSKNISRGLRNYKQGPEKRIYIF